MDLLDGYASSSSDGDHPSPPSAPAEAPPGVPMPGPQDEDDGAAAVSAPPSTAQPQPQQPTTVVGDGPVRRPLLNAAPQPTAPASVRARQARRLGAGVGGGGAVGGGSSSIALTVHQPAASAAPGLAGKPGSLLLMNNPLKSTLNAPVHGPAMLDSTGAKPQSRGDVGTATANVPFDEVTFREERTRFQRTGVASAPTETGETVVRGTLGHCRKRYAAEGGGGGGDGAAAAPDGGEDTHGSRRKKRDRRGHRTDPAELVHGSDDEATYGIWAPPSAEERARAEDQVTDLAKGVELAPEQLAERAHLAERDRRRGKAEAEGEDEAQKFDRLVERKMSHLLPPRMDSEEPVAMEPKTIFHGPAELDYKGRSWTAPPAGCGTAEPNDVDDHQCFVPKKVVARLTGHNKGVHRVRLVPRTGHLLLSAGLEGKCKVWSVPDRRVMRTYVGHTAAVRDVQFNDDGSKFLSASFDRFVRLWNTETGEVLGTYTNRRVPYVVKFYPHDDNTFVVGCSDNKIVAYDATTGQIAQEYDHHLAPVNAITFVEDHGTKMVTSSDDKKVLVWEWDIGVPVKYISDPTMHSMPVITLHPSLQYWAGQSLDNQIVVYQAGDRFALQRKKKFTGHQVAGYACDMTVSPDGRFLCSGDGDGKVYFWDWKRGKLLQKFRAHDDGPAIGCVWHPVEPSTVVTCGWDGVIKIWQ